MVRDDRTAWKSNYFEKMIVCIFFLTNFLLMLNVHLVSKYVAVYLCSIKYTLHILVYLSDTLLRSTSGTGASFAGVVALCSVQVRSQKSNSGCHCSVRGA